jgi:hypothetical protein
MVLVIYYYYYYYYCKTEDNLEVEKFHIVKGKFHYGKRNQCI